jgi:hypothetical protein
VKKNTLYFLSHKKQELEKFDNAVRVFVIIKIKVAIGLFSEHSYGQKLGYSAFAKS